MDALTPRVVLLFVSGLLNLALLWLAAYLMDRNASLQMRLDILERTRRY